MLQAVERREPYAHTFCFLRLLLYSLLSGIRKPSHSILQEYREEHSLWKPKLLYTSSTRALEYCAKVSQKRQILKMPDLFQKYLVHFIMVFFKLGRTASKVLPEHVQKCLLVHCQLAMTDVSELQVWLLVDRVLGKEWTIKDSQMNSLNTFWPKWQ